MSFSPSEQLFVYLLNRARHDPVAYQEEQNLSVDLSYVTPQAALAVNDQLQASAYFHAEEMATYNYCAHQSQVTGDWPNKMARDQGYVLPPSWTDDANYIESLGAGTNLTTATPVLNELIVDAGVSPPGHRNHLLGIGDFYSMSREIGVGHAYSSSTTYKNYWAIHATYSSTTDEFLTGVVYNDTNGNQRYDLNEGLADVTITANGLTTTTNAAGGWSIPVSNGTYVVTAGGGAFSGTGSVPVVVNGNNVEVDFISGLSTGYVNFDLWENSAPTIDSTRNATLSAILMNTSSPSGDTVGGIVANSITDPDPAALRGIAVSGLTGTANGTWQYSVNGGTTWTAFGAIAASAARLLRDTDLLRFVPANGFTGTATITYHAWDQTQGTFGQTADLSTGTGGSTAYSTGSQTATVTVLAANTAPTLNVSTPVLTPVLEDSTNPPGNTIAQIVGNSITDPDPGAAVGAAIVSLSGTGNGTWQYSLDAGASWTNFGGVSTNAARLLRNVDLVRFVPNQYYRGSATITYRAWDRTTGSAGGTADLSSPVAVGGTTAFSTATATATVTITPVNHAPVLNTSMAIVLSPVPASTTYPSGDKVANIIGGAITEVDPGDARGIAIIGVTGNGTWWFNTAGSWWSGTTSPQFAVPLKANDRVSFVPNSGSTGTATITFRAWDQTAGSQANRWVNLSSSSSVGGSTAYSSATATATVTVFSTNSAPVLDNSAAMSLAAINQGEADNPGTLVTDIIASAGGNRITDSDSVALKGIAVVGADNTNGTWQYSTDNGNTWSAFGTPSNSSARLLAADAGTRIRFVPNAQFRGLVSNGITFRAWDRTSGTYAGTASTSTNGGTTAFSTVTATASISVAYVNHPPMATVSLNNRSPKTNDLLTATATTFDADGDPVSLTYVWSVNGVVKQTHTSTALTDTFDLRVAGNGDQGDTISVQVTPADGIVSGTAAMDMATVVNAAPSGATAAHATPNPVTGTTTSLAALGADIDTGEGSLTYTWAATVLPSGALTPSFSSNGTNAAKNSTVTFRQAGTYGFTVTIADPGGLSTTSSVSVTVAQTLTSISVSPASVALNASATQQFAATAKDQFGASMASQPNFTWSTTAGTISTAGLFTARNAVGTVTVSATSGTVTGNSAVTVMDRTPTITDISPKVGAAGTTVTITGANLDGATMVKFGTTTATQIISNMATQIVVIAPEAPLGTVDVTVVTPEGTSSLSPADRFTYTLGPTVTLNWSGPGTPLRLTESVAGATPGITISEPSPNANILKIDLGAGYFFSGSSTTKVSGLTYENADSPRTSQYAMIDISLTNNVSSLVVTLPGDNLTLGLIRDFNAGLGGIVASASTIEVDGVNTSNANGNVDLRASGNLTINSGAVVQTGMGTLSLAADVKADGMGDDGAGTLTIEAGATVTSINSTTNAIALRGADIDIDTSDNPAVVGAWRSLNTTPSVTLTGVSDPWDIALDSDGNLYVTNSNAGTTVSKFAPGSTTPSAILTGMSGPQNLGLDASGNLYISCNRGTTVSKFAPGSTTASATLTGLNSPTGIAFDGSGNLFVANWGNNTVSKFAPGSTTASATLTGVENPWAMIFDGDGNLYVSSWGGTTVSKFAPGSTTPTATLTGLRFPQGLALDASGNLYVANWGSTTVSKFAPGSTTPTATLTGLVNPITLAFDGGGNLYVVNNGNSTVSKFLPGNTAPNATLTGLDRPRPLIFDGSGNLYVTNHLGNPASGSVSKFTLGSEAIPTAGGVVIRTSLSTRPMSLGGANNAVIGVNLTDAELTRIQTVSSGTVTVGDSVQTGNITFTTATVATIAGASTLVMQAADGGGQILLDDAGSGTGLSGNGGEVNLTPGTGGVVATQTAIGVPLETQGFDATGLTLTPDLNFTPTPGTQLRLINNTATPAANTPITGTFANLPQGGVITASYGGQTYCFVANYAGGDGNDLELTASTSPTVVSAAHATPNPVTGTTTSLAVLGADIDTGEGSLSYTWAATVLPSGAPVPSFSSNGTNAAKNSTVTFRQAGTYGFTVTIADPGGLSTTSSVSVTVAQTLTSISVSPASVALNASATQQFTATAKDQFGTSMASPPSFTWSTTAGTISPAGLLTASATSVSGTVEAASGSVSGTASVTVTNHAPTVVTLGNARVLESLPAGALVGRLDTSDPDPGESFAYELVAGSGSEGNASFTIVGNELRTNAVLDFETKPVYSIRVRATDIGGLSVEETLTVQVADVNETPTVALANTTTILTENTDTTGRLPVAEIVVDDDALGTYDLSLAGVDATLFELVGNVLYLRAGTRLDYETNRQLDVTVEVDDPQLGTTPDSTASLSITITDVNEAPTEITLSAASLAENLPAGTAIGTFATTDPDGDGTFVYTLVDNGSSDGNAKFTIVGNELRTVAALNHETQASYAIRVASTDAGGLSKEKSFTIQVTDVNEPPTVTLANTITSLPENTDTTNRVKVADIVITDDALGSKLLSLTGPNVGLFEITGGALCLRAGTVLDYEALSQLDVIVAVDDSSVGSTPDSTASLSIMITDVGPTAQAGGAYTVSEGGTVVLAGSGQAYGGGSEGLAYAWDFDGDGQFDDATGPTPTFSAALLDGPQTITIALQVTEQGESSIDTATVTITNAAPRITELTAPPMIGEGRTVTVSGQFQDGFVLDGHSIRIDWGDGTSSPATVDATRGSFAASHSYDTTGPYTVTANLQDDDGGVDQESLSLEVVPYLGAVGFATASIADLAEGERWFCLETTRAGYLTVEGLATAGSLQLELYDVGSSQTPLATSVATNGKERLDLETTAGKTFYLRVQGTGTGVELNLANLVHREGQTIDVFGTAGEDEFAFDATSQSVTVNGLTYQFTGDVDVHFDGSEGMDSAVLTGSSGRDAAVLTASGGRLTGPGYRVTLASIAQTTVDAGEGTDTVYLYGTEDEDTFTAQQGEATLAGMGYSLKVTGFEAIHGIGAGEGDRAVLRDSAEAERLVARPEDAQLYGQGFYLQAKGFAEVTVHATPGSGDRAELYDSRGNDTLTASPSTATLTGTGFSLTAAGFDSLVANASGGHDQALLTGSAGRDEFSAYPQYSLLRGEGYSLQVNHFDEAQAEGQGGGDVARLYDSLGDDVFTAQGRESRFAGIGFATTAVGFANVLASALRGGLDTARLQGVLGESTVTLTPRVGTLAGPGYACRAQGFANLVDVSPTEAKGTTTMAAARTDATTYDQETGILVLSVAMDLPSESVLASENSGSLLPVPSGTGTLRLADVDSEGEASQVVIDRVADAIHADTAERSVAAGGARLPNSEEFMQPEIQERYIRSFYESLACESAKSKASIRKGPEVLALEVDRLFESGIWE